MRQLYVNPIDISHPYPDIKEHVAITIFSSTAAESALAISVFAADELYYNINVRSMLLFVIA